MTTIDRIKSVLQERLYTDLIPWDEKVNLRCDPAVAAEMKATLVSHGFKVNYRQYRRCYLVSYLSAEDKLRLPQGHLHTANVDSILATGPLIRDSEPRRLVVYRNRKGEFIVCWQIIPDGIREKVSFDDGEYFRNQDESVEYFGCWLMFGEKPPRVLTFVET